MTTDDSISLRRKLTALREVIEYRPLFVTFLILFNIATATLEGVGLGFLLPIIEIIQSTGDPAANATGAVSVFVSAYEFLNIPFSLGTVVGGVLVVMTVRYVLSFVNSWFSTALTSKYSRDLQDVAFSRALDARVRYYDKEGSDDILNAILNYTSGAAGVLSQLIGITQLLLLTLVYLFAAMYISPLMTIATCIFFGVVTYLLRSVVESAEKLGTISADASKQRQRAAQAGTQGTRDIRVFGLTEELKEDFREAINASMKSSIKSGRNNAALSQFYDLTVAVTIFGLAFFAVRVANLSLSELGIFLFAMFRLGPKVSNLNSAIYGLESSIPTLVRAQDFVERLKANAEPKESSVQTPSGVQNIAFRDVEFGYSNSETVLKGVSFEASQEEFIAFVGQSGAGKSTIAALLCRLYEPDKGEILANNRDITQMDIDSWRDRIAVVRQHPFIFGDTLRYNLTIANRDATQSDIDRVCEIAKVDEFFDELPHGYETKLGEDGVRLSGGQKQRVALARALLADADILILDEATSDLDTNLEAQVQSAIEQMNNSYIIITIAHRLSTIKNADRIYAVEDGRITETGKHQELIAADGKYAELYAVQSSA